MPELHVIESLQSSRPPHLLVHIGGGACCDFFELLRASIAIAEAEAGYGGGASTAVSNVRISLVSSKSHCPV